MRLKPTFGGKLLLLGGAVTTDDGRRIFLPSSRSLIEIGERLLRDSSGAIILFFIGGDLDLERGREFIPNLAFTLISSLLPVNKV